MFKNNNKQSVPNNGFKIPAFTNSCACTTCCPIRNAEQADESEPGDSRPARGLMRGMSPPATIHGVEPLLMPEVIAPRTQVARVIPFGLTAAEFAWCLDTSEKLAPWRKWQCFEPTRASIIFDQPESEPFTEADWLHTNCIQWSPGPAEYGEAPPREPAFQIKVGMRASTGATILFPNNSVLRIWPLFSPQDTTLVPHKRKFNQKIYRYSRSGKD